MAMKKFGMLVLALVCLPLVIGCSTLRQGHPDISFNKEVPSAVAYGRSFNEVWSEALAALMSLKESTAVVDKSSGIIKTALKAQNDVSWIKKGLGTSSFLHEINLRMQEKGGRVIVEVMVSFLEEKFGERRETSSPEGANMVRHTFFSELEKRIPSVAIRMPNDASFRNIGYAALMASSGTASANGKSDPKVIPTTPASREVAPAPVPAKPAALRIKGRAANLRAVPSEKGKLVCKVPGGTEVEKVSEKGNWCNVRYVDDDGNQKLGWVKKIQVQ
jgi:hypothetical protein